MGHFFVDTRRHQVTDTPGLLYRPDGELVGLFVLEVLPWFLRSAPSYLSWMLTSLGLQFFASFIRNRHCTTPGIDGAIFVGMRRQVYQHFATERTGSYFLFF